MARIVINDIFFDPSAQAPALHSLAMDSPDTSTSDFILVQTDAPLTPVQKGELKALGAEILEYFPENAYVCRYPPASLAPIQALPYVTFAGVYPEEVKVALNLRSPANNATANLLALGPVETSMSQQPVDVDVLLHNGVDADAVRDKIAAATRLDAQELQVSRNKVRLRVRRQFLE